jgi:hypothetical protein
MTMSNVAFVALASKVSLIDGASAQMAIAETGYERGGGLSGAVSGRWAAGKTRFEGSKTRRKSCRDDQVSP